MPRKRSRRSEANQPSPVAEDRSSPPFIATPSPRRRRHGAISSLACRTTPPPQAHPRPRRSLRRSSRPRDDNAIVLRTRRERPKKSVLSDRSMAVAIEAQLGVTAHTLLRLGTWSSAIPALLDPRSRRSSCSRSSLSDVAAQPAPPRARRFHRPIPRARIRPICSPSQSKTVCTHQIR
jgi:hypothetical protein